MNILYLYEYYCFRVQIYEIFLKWRNFLHKIYKILNEIGCAKARKAQYNILNVLFFTIAENFSFKNFSIQIEISNFARNKDKESENRILYKKRFRIRKR